MSFEVQKICLIKLVAPDKGLVSIIKFFGACTTLYKDTHDKY